MKITRNGIAITLTELEAGKKSPHCGLKFPAPKFNNVHNAVEFLGSVLTLKVINRFLRKEFFDIYIALREELNYPKTLSEGTLRKDYNNWRKPWTKKQKALVYKYRAEKRKERARQRMLTQAC